MIADAGMRTIIWVGVAERWLGCRAHSAFLLGLGMDELSASATLGAASQARGPKSCHSRMPGMVEAGAQSRYRVRDPGALSGISGQALRRIYWDDVAAALYELRILIRPAVTDRRYRFILPIRFRIGF